MKKFTNIIFAIACAMILTHDIIAARRSKSQQRQRNQYLRQSQQKQQQQKMLQPAPTQLTKQETQTVKDTKKEIAQDAKTLEKEIEIAKKAKTPEEKAAAQQQAYNTAQELIQALNNERELNKDIYSEEELMQTERAKKLYVKLDTLKKKFERTLAKKETLLKSVTKKGIIWSAAMPGREQEYKILTDNVKTLKDQIKTIETAMLKPKAIVGESWISAYNVMLGATAIGVGAVIANVALFGSAGIVAATAASQLPTSWTGAFYGATKLYGYYNTANNIISNLTGTINNPNTSAEKREEAIQQKEIAEKEKTEYAQILTDYKAGKITKEQLDQKQKDIETRKQIDKK